MQQGTKTTKIVMTGLLIALTAAFTAVIAIPVPITNGYVHLGDSMVFLCVLILGKKYGAFAAGMGSALADAILGYFMWAPWTFCIKLIMAFLVGLIIEKCMQRRSFTILASVATALLWVAILLLANGDSIFVWAILLLPLGLCCVAFLLRKTEKVQVPFFQLLGMSAGGLWMVFAYYIAGGILYGSFLASALSIPANMGQFFVGFFIASLVSSVLYKTPASRFFFFEKVVK